MSSLEPKNTAVINLVDEINAVVAGIRPSDYTHFYNKYGIFKKGYIHSPAYKTGRWDGKIRFFSKNGKTSNHFLPEIVSDLKHMGYKIKFVDKRSPVDLTIPEIDKNYFSNFNDEYGDPIILGDHQVGGVNAITMNGGGILLAGTGAGKSIVAAALVNLYNVHKNFRCLIIVPNTDLIHQTSADIGFFDIPVGQYYGDVKQPNAHNVVSTWQSLQNNPQLMTMFDAIIVDECHGAQGAVLKDMLVNYSTTAPVRIGLTGTLPKEPAEKTAVHYVLGNVQYTVPAIELIEKGWLAKLMLQVIQLEEDLRPQWNYFVEKHPEDAKKVKYKKWKTNFFVEYSAEKTWVQKNRPRIDYLARMIEEKTKDSGNSFVLVNGIPFGKKLADSIENAYFVYGQDATEVRKQIYSLFAENDDVIVVSTFQLASTGLNIKRIFNLFMIDAGKSFIQIIQSIGRGLRKAKDKNSVNVYDICSDLKYGNKHLSERKKYYEEQRYTYEYTTADYSKPLDAIDDGIVY